MRIGTLTLHKANNYGAVLQAYALQRFLIDLGLNTELIDYHPNKKVNEIKRSLIQKILCHIFHIPSYIKGKSKSRKLNEFRTEFLRVSKDSLSGDKEIMHNPPQYDAYIVGSDQVWNTSITNNSKAFYLHFVKSGKKIAYAGSFGKSKFNEYEVENIQKYLTGFNFLSVREQQHQKLLADMFDIDAQVVLDPVFLLDKKKWGKLVKPCRLPKKYILVYVLEYSEEMFTHAEEMAKKLRCSVVYISLISKIIIGNVLKAIGPKEYLYAIANASYICTNSFHGTAFSIIFEKNFTVVKHTTRNSRITNIIEMSGLNDRFYDADADKVKLIDYKVVNDKMMIHIKESKQFILDALETIISKDNNVAKDGEGNCD